MIEIIRSIEEMKHPAKGIRTNLYVPAESFLPLLEEERLLRVSFTGGSYVLAEQESQYDCYFFLEQAAAPAELPPLKKPVVLEQVALERMGISPAQEEWEQIGFQPYLQRKRLFRAAKTVETEKRQPMFCREEEAELLLDWMNEVFEPYTSALPDLETLRKDLREQRVLAARAGETLLGFLRFGREKKVSVLWQIVVAETARGSGMAEGLVKDWLFLEREQAAKFQLWVREDNPSAIRLYEKTDFLPDGRIAPVLLKK